MLYLHPDSNEIERQQRALDIWSGAWGKFSRYEIHNDQIRPAPGAYFERYDPWDVYRKSLVTKGENAPYVSLMRLAEELGAYRHPDTGDWGYQQWGWDEAQRAQVLFWCERFGLLGILPHIAISIDLPPRRFSRPVWNTTHYSYRCYIRNGGKWTERRDDLPGFLDRGSPSVVWA
jgi:hypothetical protein